MPDSGTDLGADLFGLYKVAKVNLPDVANQYQKAASAVDAAAANVGAAFNRAPEFGGSTGQAFGPWLELQSSIHNYLRNTADNLNDTANALLMAVDGYSASDQGAANELNRLKNANGLK